MNWDEEAKWESAGRYFNAIPTAPQTRMRVPFIEGARWQRDQLRTDEAVERVAEHLFARTQDDYEYMDRTDWHELHKSNQDVYRSDARMAITSLLGEDT